MEEAMRRKMIEIKTPQKKEGREGEILSISVSPTSTAEDRSQILHSRAWGIPSQ